MWISKRKEDRNSFAAEYWGEWDAAVIIWPGEGVEWNEGTGDLMMTMEGLAALEKAIWEYRSIETLAEFAKPVVTLETTEWNPPPAFSRDALVLIF
jgi:hypothetical protein